MSDPFRILPIAGGAELRMSTAPGRQQRIEELNALGDYYSDQGCPLEAADYYRQAADLAKVGS